MPEFVIERNTPGSGAMTADDRKRGAQASCRALREVGPEIQWISSYVSDDKMYCVFRAPSEDLIREHAQRAGVPADRISAVRAVMDPTLAE